MERRDDDLDPRLEAEQTSSRDAALLSARPDLLGSAEGRRQHAEVRARLFATQPLEQRIGRYVVTRRLGQGGLGVVYACHDPVLGRDVAVKLLRTGALGAARLRREARAMAQLSHPNTASVFEVGEHAGQVFLAMELVDGITLRRWQRGRSLFEILDVYVAAAHGLAAAHAVGMVHRDFKPDNVMVGSDGRVRVLDFGLATAAAVEVEQTTPTERIPPRWAARSDGSVPTSAGRTAGTPAYMAPEQIRGAKIDPRADQFAFAVALFEACFGTRPFAGNGLGEIAAAISREEIVWPTDSAVPRRLQATLARALRAAPTDRFPDMMTMLGCLTAVRRSRSRRAVVAALAACVAIGSALMYFDRSDPDAVSFDGIEVPEQPSPTDDDHALAIAIEDARELGRGGDHQGAAAAADAAVELARSVGSEAMLAEALLVAAEARAAHRDHVGAEAKALEAYWIAEGLGHDRLALRAATALVAAVGNHQRRREDALHWARIGQALTDRLPNGDYLTGRFLINRGHFRITIGDSSGARSDFDGALVILEALGDADTSERLPVFANLAWLDAIAGDYDSALRRLDEVIALREIYQGTDHPKLVSDLNNRAFVAIASDRWLDAHASLDRAEAIGRRWGDARGLAFIEQQRASLAFELGEFSDALVHAERALAADPTRLTAMRDAQVIRARATHALGDLEGARTQLNALIADLEASNEIDENAMIIALLAVAEVEIDLAPRDHATARRWLERVTPLVLRDAGECERARLDVLEARLHLASGETLAAIAAVDGGPTRCALVAAEVSATLARAHARAGDMGLGRRFAVAAQARWIARGGGWIARALALAAELGPTRVQPPISHSEPARDRRELPSRQ